MNDTKVVFDSLREFTQEDKLDDVLHVIVNDFEKYSAGLPLYHAGYQRWIRTRPIIILCLMDMPQRHDCAHMKRQNSVYGCCLHCMCTRSHLHCSPTMPQVQFSRRRTVPSMQLLHKEWLACHNHSISSANSFNQRNGTDFNLTPNPLWRLYQLCHFDFHNGTPVDLFHVEILGLVRWHIGNIYEVLTEKEKVEFQGILAELNKNQFGHHLGEWKCRNFWNGDNWLEVFSVMPFVLKRLLGRVLEDRRDILFPHYTCWCMHARCVRILLRPTLTFEEICEAERLCIQWRKDAVSLYGQTECGRPNFHAILHVFEFAKEFGPPTLYWTRPFEHKHAVFRRWMDQFSNNSKNDEFQLACREMLLLHVRSCVPNLSLIMPQHFFNNMRQWRSHAPEVGEVYAVRNPFEEDKRMWIVISGVVKKGMQYNALEIVPTAGVWNSPDPHLQCPFIGLFQIPGTAIALRMAITNPSPQLQMQTANPPLPTGNEIVPLNEYIGLRAISRDIYFKDFLNRGFVVDGFLNTFACLHLTQL